MGKGGTGRGNQGEGREIKGKGREIKGEERERKGEGSGGWCDEEALGSAGSDHCNWLRVNSRCEGMTMSQ